MSAEFTTTLPSENHTRSAVFVTANGDSWHVGNAVCLRCAQPGDWAPRESAVFGAADRQAQACLLTGWSLTGWRLPSTWRRRSGLRSAIRNPKWSPFSTLLLDSATARWPKPPLRGRREPLPSSPRSSVRSRRLRPPDPGRLRRSTREKAAAGGGRVSGQTRQGHPDQCPDEADGCQQQCPHPKRHAAQPLHRLAQEGDKSSPSIRSGCATVRLPHAERAPLAFESTGCRR